MNHYLVNGIEKDLAETVQNLSELIHQIRKAHTTETTLISSILVNGIEINEQEEHLIGNVPVSSLRSLEIFTAHPKEIAEETLQSLVEFTKHLEEMCERVGEFPNKLPALADGVM